MAVVSASWIVLGATISLFAYDIFHDATRHSFDSHALSFVLSISVILAPLIVLSIAVAVVLQGFGINVDQLLFASGVLGIVIGLALQGTLSNVFARYGVMAGDAVLEGDLIVLDDGRICRVDQIGYMTTKLYYIKEHSMVYIPNSTLAGETISNISRPTIGLRVAIPIGLSYSPQMDIDEVATLLVKIAKEHPNVLLELESKDGTEGKIAILQRQLTSAKEPAKYQAMLLRLQAERDLDIVLDDVFTQLTGKQDWALGHRLMGRHTRRAEETRAELDKALELIEKKMELWENTRDPWAEVGDYNNPHFIRAVEKERKVFERKKKIFLDTINEGTEHDVEEKTSDFAKWLREQFKPKITSGYNPFVYFVQFDSSTVDVSLEFYVDDIRLNNYRRKDRVIRDLAAKIKREFDAHDPPIEFPNPQSDVHVKEPLLLDSVKEEVKRRKSEEKKK
jgi:MscS family membrane protein